MFDNIKTDLRMASKHNYKGLSGIRVYLAPLGHIGTQAVLLYRFGHWAINLKIPIVGKLLFIFYLPIKYLFNLWPGINIPTHADIGPGLVVHTWNGVYVPCCKIGRNAYFQHGVVVNYDCKGIGDDVYFGPGAKVIREVRIGNRVKIGANAVVTKDIPDDCTVAGVPARIVSGPGSNGDASGDPDEPPGQT